MSDEINYTTEVWKTIPEAPMYSVSTHGRVRRHVWHRGRPPQLLKPGLTTGYRKVIILNAALKRTAWYVSRLMALAFLPPDPSRPFVNHKNGTRHDDRIENLEWVTHQENMLHAVHILGRKSLAGEAHPGAKLTEEAVFQIRAFAKLKIKQRDIAKMFGVDQKLVWMIKHRLAWKHLTP